MIDQIMTPFVVLSPFPFPPRYLNETDFTTSLIGPLSLAEAVEIFWKLKSISITGALAMEYSDTSGAIYSDSAEFDFHTENNSDCIASLEPRARVCAKVNRVFCDARAYINDVPNGASPMTIEGPFILADEDELPFAERSFFYTVSIAIQIESFGLVSARETPSGSTFVVSTVICSLLGQEFNLYFTRETSNAQATFYCHATFTYSQYLPPE